MNKNSIKITPLLTFFGTIAVVLALSLGISGCGTDETPPKVDTTGNTESSEYLIINGTRYEAADIVSKKFVTSNEDITLRIEFGPRYPSFDIEHEGTSISELVEREYDIAPGGNYFPDGDLYEVGMFFAEGDPPMFCQYRGITTPSTPHGKYELKTVDGKLVSEFKKAQLECVDGNTGDSEIIIEGYVIWEEK